jgi:hypothetical protein
MMGGYKIFTAIALLLLLAFYLWLWRELVMARGSAKGALYF